ncbi:cyclic pyranopterin monophosphate synthase MoaC [Gloeobacter kilaueensis]|uniref:Cyclic pyranopterin monophosphate synthase n=1 Tax=Gloeobacter kilaueensis (strain ATCC BAA-2537 / CCAP 1431/1 / ULC 316 / JS1) TaxID=1183438 RepID=U5QG05_GLOK1|nr:cyclic pyranopterin monophosphate synthase MoaC [Gloeobacter kilaueensis]AGY56610.1 molybdenum cofactor biosynthesis protein MoaC [Gloeobacter kilaueensis JS1]
MQPLSHLDTGGEARMVDVTAKAVGARVAVAEARLRMEQSTFEAILTGNAPKGDVLSTARLAGIMAAKRTSDLIPLCHPLPLGAVQVEIVPAPELPGFRVQTTVKTQAQTGVEMEALTAAAIAALTLYDMAKALQKDMVIEQVRLIRKSGGKSGDFEAAEHD